MKSECVSRPATSLRGGKPRQRRLAKRGFDLLLLFMVAPIALPLIAVFWLAARSDGGPGFFGHRRIGRNGEPFTCWKIRTMAVDAEDRLAALLRQNPEAAAQWRRDRKLNDDPRVTRVGHFLRRTSMDELPQLWNVLKGEMSFVGPRPVVEEELARYGSFGWLYLSVRPGLTGPWQVSGRNDASYDERVRMDVEYFSSATVLGDTWLVIRTAGAVLKGTGR